jgi:hypothetical protein
VAKYDPLGEYLKGLPPTTKRITLTFQKIEEIIGQDMEQSARVYFRTWDNIGDKSAVRQNSWLDVHRKTIMVDMENETVKFQRG